MLCHLRHPRVFLIATFSVSAFAFAASADRIELAGGGHVDGELVNRDREGNEPFIIRTEFGKVILRSADVASAKLLRKEQELYERYLRRVSTADDNWKLAEWCKQNNLLQERLHHLNEVIRLDPEHQGARKALRYVKRDGEWITRDAAMNRRGFVRHKGQWRLPQEIAIAEAREQEATKIREYRNQLNRWRSWFGKRREDEAAKGVQQLDDPLAVPTILEQLERENRTYVIRLYVDALGRIGSTAATRGLIDLALATDDDEFRILCLEKIETPDQIELASSILASALESPQNERIHRAATSLAQIGAPNAILPLIDALVTTHTIKVGQGQEGRIAPTFTQGPGGSGGGLSVGGKPKIRRVQVKNRPVLQSLLELTDNVNFDFDQDSWRQWYESQHGPVNVNLRRDN